MPFDYCHNVQVPATVNRAHLDAPLISTWLLKRCHRFNTQRNNRTSQRAVLLSDAPRNRLCLRSFLRHWPSRSIKEDSASNCDRAGPAVSHSSTCCFESPRMEFCGRRDNQQQASGHDLQELRRSEARFHAAIMGIKY